MSLTKEGEEKKQSLIVASLKLFIERGYEHTSINDIIEKVGVSKGAFYHYFDSKEDVLDAVTWQEVEGLIRIARDIADDTTLNALEKLNRLIAESLRYKTERLIERMKLYRIVAEERNTKMVNRIMEKTFENTLPIICAIVNQGTNEGFFDAPYPDEAGEWYLHMANIYNSMLGKYMMSDRADITIPELMNKKIAFYEHALERVLGVPKGSIALSEHVMKLIWEFNKLSEPRGAHESREI